MSTITVRMHYTALLDVEAELIKAGVPPMADRRGLMNRWFDPSDDAWVYEFTPIEEAMKT